MDDTSEHESRASSFNEDTHFYVDNAPPTEVAQVLRVLSREKGLTPQKISEILLNEHNFAMQKDCTYAPRRLADLGLADQVREGGRRMYKLNPLGVRVQRILQTDVAFAMDLLHYLHFTGYRGRPSDRKNLWSYRRCCELIQSAGYMLPPASVAATIQGEMRTSFSHLDWNAKVGGRFNSNAVSAVYTWLRALDAAPIDRVKEPIVFRHVQHYELALLALDDVYSSRGYHYGDPVLLDGELTQAIALVFFMDSDRCSELIQVAARITPFVKISDTLAGPSIRLMRPVTIEGL